MPVKGWASRDVFLKNQELLKAAGNRLRAEQTLNSKVFSGTKLGTPVFLSSCLLSLFPLVAEFEIHAEFFLQLINVEFAMDLVSVF